MVSQAFERLQRQVKRQTTVTASAIELLNGLAEKLDDIAKAPSQKAINDLANQLRDDRRSLAAAMAVFDSDEDKPKPPGEIPDEPDEDNAAR